MTQTSSDLHDLTVAQLADLIRTRKVSAVELAQHFLERATTHQALGAFLDIQADVTLTQARASDARLAAGTGAALEGVPLAHKDIFVTKKFCFYCGIPNAWRLPVTL